MEYWSPPRGQSESFLHGADETMLVGLTGQMGVGKTTLAGHLHGCGARIVDADRLGHEILERAGVKRRLEEAFGTNVIGVDGAVDRRALAELAFADAAGVSLLNSIVGEPLNEELWNRVKGDRGTCDTTVIVDAALLIEWGMHRRFDVIVVVTADDEDALRRLEVSRGFSRSEILPRRQAQGAVEDKLAVADFVVHNDGDLKSFEQRAHKLWGELERLRLQKPTNSVDSAFN